MKKQTGIWLDLRNAWIIKLSNEHEDGIKVEHVSSEIEETAAVGGTRSKTPWGPQGGDNQRSIEEKRHHEEKHFFTEILKHIDPKTDELVIFGPSEAKHGLNNLLEDQHHAPVIKGVESAAKMTQPQMVAWVREYFDRPAPRLQPQFGREHKG